MLGKKFGRLTVLKELSKRTREHKVYVCMCDCGFSTTVVGSSLRSGNSRSCGCVKVEKFLKRITTHGMSRTPEYKVWSAIKDRCLNKKNVRYKYYGGRGIRLCNRWKLFKNFISDMGVRPSKLYSIDRINNNNWYSKDNCRWVTRRTQDLNKSNNRILTHMGSSHTISEWSNITGISLPTISSRLSSGWSVEKTLTAPIQKEELITYNGLSLSRKDWAKRLGSSYVGFIEKRLSRGWSLDRALSTPIISRKH